MARNRLKKIIASIPDSPGVYLMKDANGRIIYIGKAKSLRKRVQSYFSRRLDTKTQIMVSKISDIGCQFTPSEAQAQILEASLIKLHQPQYNIDLKDDKSFPWVRITQEAFPVVSICRRKKILKGQKALYFGPYTNSKLLREAMRTLRRTFGFRSCGKIPKEACLFGRIQLCPAPCTGSVSGAEYARTIEKIRLVLEGRTQDLIESLSRQMRQKVKGRKYEEAARIRDQISALGSVEPSRTAAGSNLEPELLKRDLHLKRLPLRIEAFDISNIYGRQASGSMVSFYRGLPDKDNYRRFRIKSVRRIDDYAMVRETVRRRYSRLLAEKLLLPDLILIDGGKGHLLAAAEELESMNLGIDLISIAKEKENIYCLNRSNPIRLKEGSPALNLIRRVRDEAHRFALSYHRLLRRRKILG